jgi:undecaprenyl-diphosphatase
VVATQVSELGRRAARAFAGLRPPQGAELARDVSLLHALPVPTDAGIAWANLVSDHGATDMWLQLARGLGERQGPTQARQAVDLLREARATGRALRDRSKQLHFRARPFVDDPTLRTFIHRPVTSSFPSGHAMANHFNATIMATLDPTNAEQYWWLATQGSAARVFGRVHYPSDVVAGARLGRSVAQDVLLAHGLEPAAAPAAERLADAATYARFGMDAEAAARIVSLMPADVRAAGATRAGDAPLHAWFGPREYDNALVF